MDFHDYAEYGAKVASLAYAVAQPGDHPQLEREMAEAFLEVLEREKKLSLTKASIRIIQNGIETYAGQPDADPELVQALRAGAETRINVKFL